MFTTITFSFGAEIQVLESPINGDYLYESKGDDFAPPKTIRIIKIADREKLMQKGDPIVAISDPGNIRPNYSNGCYYETGKVNIIFTESVINNGFVMLRIYRGTLKDGDIVGTTVCQISDHDDFASGYKPDANHKAPISFTMRKIKK